MIGTVLAVVLILVGVGIYYINASSINTITVYKDTVEDKIYKKGIVTAYSTVVKAEESGEALFNLKEGKLIKPYTKVGTVYSGNIDEESKEILRALNDKIVFSEALSSSQKYIIGDLATVNRDINESFFDVITQTNENNYENVYELKSKILTYNEKVLSLKGIKVEKKNSENIENEIAKTEQKLNYSKKVYTSPVNGMFSTKVSNYDELINPDIALTLKPSEYDKIASQDYKEYSGVEKGRGFYKIINNYEWYIVSKFKKEEIKDLEKGESIKVRVINNSDNAVEGKIAYISEIEKNEAVVVIKSTKHIDNIWTDGQIEFELIKSTKTGIKIPVNSIVEKDGKKGVYVIKDSVYKFIEIEPILYDKNYVIIKDKGVDEASERNNVILYDFVVINPKNVVEGAIAN